MGHAYTPGLKVSAAAEFTRSRRLPIPGEVLVQAGAEVEPDTVVARALLPGNVSIAHLSKTLGVAAADLPELMLVEEGAEVKQGQPIARSKGIFGLMKQTAVAPTTGVLESVSKVSGQAIFREPPIPVDSRAYIAGTVSHVEPGFGVDVTARGTMVQGIFGIGPETDGPVMIALDDPSKPLLPEHIKPGHRNAVVVGGSIARLDTLKAAVAAGVRAVVTGGIDSADLEELLGYDLGVAITGNETVGLTLVVTEGFGGLTMARRTLKLLTAAKGLTASVSGATQIRAGVMRPDVLIPGSVASIEETAVDTGMLAVGSAVRIIRDPHFGSLARVDELPPEPRLLETESAVRILTVALPDGTRATLPRANVELVDETL